MQDQVQVVDLNQTFKLEVSPTLDEADVTIEKQIEEGGQGCIYIGKYKDKNAVIKVFKQDEIDVREIKAYNMLEHETMVKYYGYFIDKKDKLNLVLEYAEGEDLSDIIPDGYLTLDQKFEITIQLASFINYLRDNHAIHRDLKPQNLKINIVDNKVSLKVIDFGLSRISNKTNIPKSTANNGTTLYVPPELYDPSIQNVNYKFDIWSFGVILSYLFSGEIPYSKLKPLAIEASLVYKKPFPIPEMEDKNIKKIITFCTDVDPAKRINTKVLLKLIEMAKNKEDISDFAPNQDDLK